MTTARRGSWSGVLVSDRGRAVLLRGTSGSVVVPSPVAVAGTGTAILYDDDTGLLYAEGTAVRYST